MKVFKFGGASVKESKAVRNVAEILGRYKSGELLVVISAMGKTTNSLENLVNAFYSGDTDINPIFAEIKAFHYNIISELIPDSKAPIHTDIEDLFLEMECMLERGVGKDDYDMIYDQIVSYGELISTRIVSDYLQSAGIRNKWVDARNFIITDSTYREGRVNWEETSRIIDRKLKPIAERSLVITQGFIGKDNFNNTTTLGREGSDYSAAIFAYCLKAESLTIWKDVAGVMNADPKRLADAVKLEQINYNQAIELAYYGASVIHPKTIQPLQSSDIPLYVSSFINPDEKGTVVNNDRSGGLPSCYIFKDEQSLISVSTRNFSFIAEDNLGDLFTLFSECRIRINVMQNSAISFSVCVDTDERKINMLKERLSEDFIVSVTTGCMLVTVYNSNDKDDLVPVIGT
ncbi:MAG: aspartate kinase, partial [Bacteroidia bacterium]|nr:aspartate kinase [Bacteroidia bacterium]